MHFHTFSQKTNIKLFQLDKHVQFTNLKPGMFELKLPDTVENIVGTVENAGHQHFLLFRHCFQMATF